MTKSCDDHGGTSANISGAGSGGGGGGFVTTGGFAGDGVTFASGGSGFCDIVAQLTGGGVLLQGFDVVLDAASVITANGGDGGIVDMTRFDGCGGTGQIAIVANEARALVVNGTLEASAGSGVLNDTACDQSFFA